jgi:hypothetical protein
MILAAILIVLIVALAGVLVTNRIEAEQDDPASDAGR